MKKVLLLTIAFALTACSSKVSEEDFKNIYQQGYEDGYAGGQRDAINDYTVPEWAKYVLNVNKMEYHDPSCSRIKNMSIDVIALYGGNTDLLDEKGFVPCKVCNP